MNLETRAGGPCRRTGGWRGAAAVVLCVMILAAQTGCAGDTGPYAGYKRYTRDIVGLFDTVISIVAYCTSQEDFDRMAAQAETRFTELHRLYDVYNAYEGINNLNTVNASAGGAAVPVAVEILDLLDFCRTQAAATGGRVDITLGAMLAVWSDARTAGRNDPDNAVLPGMEALRSAAALSGFRHLSVDRAAGTVRIDLPGMALDVGAVAKGFATRIVEEELAAAGWESFLISNGSSSIVLHGRPFQDDKETWTIGLQNPSALLPEAGQDADAQEPFIAVARLNDRAVGNSGDYQNYYRVDGKAYNHLIDPDTLLPATEYRGVSVFTDDCGLADLLSSTLFLLPYEEGRALVESMEGTDAIWIFPGGRVETTPGIRSALTDTLFDS
ncbi:MAG: FAD:protein FMN transferase [Clostridia bacterium]|nr:FAD:protein FMN transferase [Clostridia bacterium]